VRSAGKVFGLVTIINKGGRDEKPKRIYTDRADGSGHYHRCPRCHCNTEVHRSPAQARVAAAKADVSIIREGLGLYAIDYGDYPTAVTYTALRDSLVDADGHAYVTLPAEGATIDNVIYAADTLDGYHFTAEIIGVPTNYTHKYVGANEDSVWTKDTSPY